MRWYVNQEFERYLSDVLDRNSAIKVAMVGGYSTDPELLQLTKILTNYTVTYYGIESDSPFEYVDINLVNAETINDKYDVVLCSQVIEHIWNINSFFQFLEKLTKENGLLWISCPYSNITHGSPDFFSAGYTPEFLANNLGRSKWEFLCLERVGTKRNYYATHLLGTWLSRAELNRPVLNYQIKPGTLLGITRKFFNDLPGRFLLSLVRNQITNNPRWSTDSYLLAKKK